MEDFPYKFQAFIDKFYRKILRKKTHKNFNREEFVKILPSKKRIFLRAFAKPIR